MLPDYLKNSAPIIRPQGSLSNLYRSRRNVGQDENSLPSTPSGDPPPESLKTPRLQRVKRAVTCVFCIGNAEAPIILGCGHAICARHLWYFDKNDGQADSGHEDLQPPPSKKRKTSPQEETSESMHSEEVFWRDIPRMPSTSPECNMPTVRHTRRRQGPLTETQDEPPCSLFMENHGGVTNADLTPLPSPSKRV